MMTTDEARAILGSAAEGKTDTQLERLVSELSALADSMYTELAAKHVKQAPSVPEDAVPGFEGEPLTPLERVKWAAYHHENGGAE